MIAYSSLGWLILLFGGIVWAGYGLLGMFAAGMSSAPSARDGNRGCLVLVIGLAAIAVAVWGLWT